MTWVNWLLIFGAFIVGAWVGYLIRMVCEIVATEAYLDSLLCSQNFWAVLVDRRANDGDNGTTFQIDPAMLQALYDEFDGDE